MCGKELNPGLLTQRSEHFSRDNPQLQS